MPRSTAAWRNAIISCLSGIGLSSWLIRMQPRPRAETSRLLFPSLRVCIYCAPLLRSFPWGYITFLWDRQLLMDGPVSQHAYRHCAGWRQSWRQNACEESTGDNQWVGQSEQMLKSRGFVE